MKVWYHAANELVAKGKLLCCLMTAWSLMSECEENTRERKAMVAKMKKDVLANCSPAKPFPSKVCLIMDKWIETGHMDLAVKDATI